MSLVAISGNASGTGTLTIAAPNTNSNYTLTLPENTGTLISTASTFAGTGPTFSVYPSASQSIANTTSVLIQCDTKTGSSQLFDTAGAFNNTASTATLNGISVPAWSFAPPVAGYYMIGVYGSLSGATGLVSPQIRVNTTFVNVTSYASSSSYLGGTNQVFTYLNGTGDYVQFYLYQNSGVSQSTLASRPDLYKFFGNLVRAA